MLVKQTNNILGESFNIGALFDFDGQPVDMTVSGALIAASLISTAGVSIADVTLAAIPNFPTQCKMTITGPTITDAIDDTGWFEPTTAEYITVPDGTVFRVADGINIDEDDGDIETIAVLEINANVLKVQRGANPFTLATGQTMNIVNRGSTAEDDYAADAEVVDITVTDASVYSIGNTLVTPEGEILTITGITDDVLTVTRDGSHTITQGDILLVTNLSVVIPAGNIFDNRTLKDTFTVDDGSKFIVGDTIQAVAEVMTITGINGNILTVTRGAIPENLANNTALTLTNRKTLIPTRYHTIVIESATDAIVTRNLPIEIVTSKAYNQALAGQSSSPVIFEG